MTEGVWRVAFPNGDLMAEALRFLRDGSVSGHPFVVALRWQMDGEVPCLIGSDGAPVIVFRQCGHKNELDAFTPSGTDPVFRMQHWDWEQRPRWPALTRLCFQQDIATHGWEIGEHSYGLPTVHERMAKLRIGRYVSIADGVRIALGNHRIDSVTTYPFAALSRWWPSAPDGTVDHVTRGDVVIGNDVWIGAGAFIGSGVTIGDGAVIGAMAVVTRDVPPYGIALGNPARCVRFRFSEPIIHRLLDIAWWNWPEEKVDRFIPRLLDGDIEAFIAASKSGMNR